MKIGIHTWGSEGDVRPFLVLADGLAQAGHEVRLAYNAVDGRDYAARLAHAPYQHQRLASARSPEELRRIGGEILSDPKPLRQLTRVIEEALEPVIDEMTQSAGELAKWADVLVLHPIAHPLAAAAEAARKPFVCVHPIPAIVTRELPPPGFPHLGVLNALTWKLTLALLSAKLIGSVNRARAHLGLEPIQRIEQQLGQTTIDLVAMSPTLLPRPADWPPKVHLSGFLIPPPGPQTAPLDPELETFLAQGPAPIYLTFGSMSVGEADPHAIVELVEGAIDAAGCRAIVQTDVQTDVLGPSSSKVLRVSGSVAHDQVFPRCAAIVHHGGAGTTQAALRAGRPSVIVAHITDQFLWGRQLHKLGVAPLHLKRRALKAGQLTQAITQATQDTAMRAQAERLGTQMRQEDGVRRALELIGLVAAGRSSP